MSSLITPRLNSGSLIVPAIIPKAYPRSGSGVVIKKFLNNSTFFIITVRKRQAV